MVRKKRPGISVLLVAPTLYPGYGAARVTIDLATGLLERGMEPVVVCIGIKGGTNPALDKNIRQVVHGRNQGTIGWAVAIVRLVHLIRVEQPDYIVSVLTGTNIATSIARILARSRSPLVLTEHSIQSLARGRVGSRIWGLMGRHLGSIYRLGTVTVAVSESVRNDLVRNCGVPEEIVAAIENPVDSERLRKLSDAPEQYLCNYRPEYRWIVSVGELKPVKRQHLLVEALVHLPAEFAVILFGDGPCEERLRTLAANLGVGERVVLAGHCDNPWPTVRRAELSVLVSEYEGFGLAIAESAAIGTPVAACGVPGLLETVRACGGYILSADTPAELAHDLLAATSRTSRYVPPVKWLAGREPHVVAQQYIDAAQRLAAHGD